MKNRITNLFATKVDASGLAIFRILYSIILFFELKQIFTFRHVVYDKIPFVLTGELNVEYIFFFWFIVIFFLFLGLFTRLTSIINYIFSVIVFSSAVSFEYHIFYAYVGINFIMMFMPVARVLSLDSLLEKLKYSSTKKIHTVDRNVLLMNYLVPVFIAIALVYFDSIFFKLTSSFWMDGLGMWLPANIPMVTWTDSSWLMNQEVLVKFLGYLVIVFESLFIVLMWFKRFRIPLMLIGIFFHLGILMEFAIPFFALTAVGIYLLMAPPSWWLWIGKKIKCKTPSYKFYYDNECPLCTNVVICIQHFDVFGKIACIPVQGNWESEAAFKGRSEEELLINIHGVDKKGKVYTAYKAYTQLLFALVYTYPIALFCSIPGISHAGQKIYKMVAGNRLTTRCTVESCGFEEYTVAPSEDKNFLFPGWNKLNISKITWGIVLVFFSLTEIIIAYKSPYVQDLLIKTNLRYNRPNEWANSVYENSKTPLVKFFGITHHPVFMNYHFADYNSIISTEFVDESGKSYHVPLIDKNGMPDRYIHGAFWVNYTFSVSRPRLDIPAFEIGVNPYLQHFLRENKLSTTKGKFIFHLKKVDIPTKWEKDFLRNQFKKPWTKVGEYKLENSKYNWDSSVYEMIENNMN